MTKIEGVIDELLVSASEDHDPTVSHLLESFGSQAFGPLLLVPGILMVSPLSGIPTVPTLLACWVGLVCFQLLRGHSSVKLPRWLSEKSLDGDKLTSALKTVKPAARAFDQVFHARLQFMFSKVARIAAGCLAILLALSIPPLELLPLAALIPGCAIAILGVALTTKDGLLMAFWFIGVGVGAVLAFFHL